MSPVAVSAGALLYRLVAGTVEVLIAHPGGPIWAKRNDGAWSIPKGLVETAEDMESAARREFTEETGHELPADLVDLGTVRLRSGKTVHCFAALGDLDPSTAVSMTFTMEWPPRSGRHIEVPEIDRVAWVDPDRARRLLNPAQAAFVDRLLLHLDAEQG